MICPHCNNEMEQGRIMASGVGNVPVAILEFYPETEFDKKGIIAALKRKAVNIKDAKDGYYHNSHHCPQCNKVFAEFPTKPPKVKKS